MSWYDGGARRVGGLRRRTALGGLLTAMLAGCGFQPLYGAPVAGLQATQVGVFANRDGQILRNHLMPLINPRGVPAEPLFRLDASLGQSETEIGVLDDGQTRRRNVTYSVAYRLTRLADGTVLLDTQSVATAGYNVLPDLFATEASRRDAIDRVLRLIATEMRSRLALYFDRAGLP